MHPTQPQSETEQALDAFTQAIEAWDPDTAPGVEAMLDALRDLHLKFDPRRDRASAAMCMTSMKLLENLQRSGSVGFAETVGALGELSHGLRETLVSAQGQPGPGRPTPASSMVMLGGSGSSSTQGSGLSLAIGGLREQTLPEIMVSMNMLTQEQADHALELQSQGEDPDRTFGEVVLELGYASEMTLESAQRLHARSQGEIPDARPAEDGWGNSPL